MENCDQKKIVLTVVRRVQSETAVKKVKRGKKLKRDKSVAKEKRQKDDG